MIAQGNPHSREGVARGYVMLFLFKVYDSILLTVALPPPKKTYQLNSPQFTIDGAVVEI